jgi:hypothetical protein
MLVAVLVGGVYLTFLWEALAQASFQTFSFGVADQLMSVSFFLLPVLLIAGADFAEWAEVVGDRLTYVARRVGSKSLVAALAAAISLGVLAHVLASDAAEVPSGIVLFTLAGLAVCAVARGARPAGGWPHQVPWVAVTLVAFAFVAVLLVEVYRTTPGPAPASAVGRALLHPYRRSTQPRFEIRFPSGWESGQLEPHGAETLVEFRGSTARLYVMAVSAYEAHGGPGALPELLARLYPRGETSLGAGHEDRGWRRTPVSLNGRPVGVAWDRQIETSDWLLLGISDPDALAANRKVFESMWSSLAVGTHQISPLSAVHQLVHRRLDPYRYDPVLVVPFLVWLAVAVAVSVALPVLASRLSPSLVLGAVFILAFALLFVLSDLRQVVEELVDAPVDGLYSLRLPGIQAAVALLTLGLLTVMLARGHLVRERPPVLRDLVMLGAGLQLLTWLSQLYRTASLTGARLSIAQGIVILVALLWELIVSGEQLTNRHTRALPRATRVLVLCGYLMLVATAVLFFSSLREHGTGAPLEPQFESEAWPSLGIVQLGVPLILCLAALRLGAFTRGRSPAPRRAAPAPATAPTTRPPVEQPDAR